ncbi:MAG: retroviral-like aspartic protease family protein [Pseudomonadales bacterium]|nr:retroviral-like aspartic protease family protein [Pseudomonadales bacterium]
MTLFKKLLKKLGIPVFALLVIPFSVESAPSSSATDLDIQVKGLFSQSAILSINGKQHLLKQNSVSPEGVKLISATSRTAVISVNGKQQTLHLSGKVTTQYAKASRRNVTIPLNAQGQYLTHGLINGQSTELLVDTGASVVAMSETQARQLGIPYVTKGTRGYVETASHTVNSYVVTLDQIDIGGLKAYNVQAVVLEGDLPSKILLGMSYLRHVELYEKQGMLNLLEKR